MPLRIRFSAWGVLLFGHFVNDVPHLVIAATLHRLHRAQDFVDGSAQDLCSVDHNR